MKNKKQGFALLIAIIFMSVMLSFGLALGSIGYKQQVLASSAIESQYAFYAADAALECALYADQRLNLFAYPASDPGSAPVMTCDNTPWAPSAPELWNSFQWVITYRVGLDKDSSGNPRRCADVTVYKPAPGSGILTYIFSQGYDVSCGTVNDPKGARFVSRGLYAHY